MEYNTLSQPEYLDVEGSMSAGEGQAMNTTPEQHLKYAKQVAVSVFHVLGRLLKEMHTFEEEAKLRVEDIASTKKLCARHPELEDGLRKLEKKPLETEPKLNHEVLTLMGRNFMFDENDSELQGDKLEEYLKIVKYAVAQNPMNVQLQVPNFLNVLPDDNVHVGGSTLGTENLLDQNVARAGGLAFVNLEQVATSLPSGDADFSSGSRKRQK